MEAKVVYIECFGREYRVCTKKDYGEGCPIKDFCYEETSARLGDVLKRRFLYLHKKEVWGHGFSSVEIPKIGMWAVFMDVIK